MLDISRLVIKFCGWKLRTYIFSLGCLVGVHKSNNKPPIQDVMDITLRMILFCITCVAGITGPHLATHAQVDYTVLCRDGVLFNWSVTLLVNMKEQLTRCRIGQHR